MISSKKRKNSILLKESDYIYKCAYRFCGNRMDAEDLTQETFYLAYRNFHQLKDTEKCKGWLFSILRNLYLKEIEVKQKEKLVDIDDYIEKFAADPGGEATESEMDISSDDIRKALDVLEEKYKTPLLLFYFNDFSYKEIAGTMDIPIGTVMSRIARSKLFLRRYLNNTVTGENSGKIIPLKRGCHERLQ
ncbi:MAG: sigma-70 family RNA polymerase sigma factor [bacterium]|nr:sigma-70 family RNA polymerase sigma factor [bacterium]